MNINSICSQLNNVRYSTFVGVFSIVILFSSVVSEEAQAAQGNDSLTNNTLHTNSSLWEGTLYKEVTRSERRKNSFVPFVDMVTKKIPFKVSVKLIEHEGKYSGEITIDDKSYAGGLHACDLVLTQVEVTNGNEYWFNSKPTGSRRSNCHMYKTIMIKLYGEDAWIEWSPTKLTKTGRPVFDRFNSESFLTKSENKIGRYNQKYLASEYNRVLVRTNFGDITIELYPEIAPKTVFNFLGYIKEGYYSGTVFHQVKKDFIISGGSYTVDYVKKETRGSIKNEASKRLLNVRGSVSMSRNGRKCDSATTEFFINLANNASLNYHGDYYLGCGYAAFGKIIKGMAVLDKINDIPTGSNRNISRYVPLKKVIIESISIIQ